ncbi:MAG: glycosyltransferase [Actinomycetota bacterium]|nr:glycosyltransferase [Actinomycetota bacterium]
MAGLAKPSRRWATAWRMLRTGDLSALTRRTLSFLRRLGDRAERMDYREWRDQWVEIDDIARNKIDALVSDLPHRPSFTLLISVDGANTDLIVATAVSLTAQRYQDWVLCLASEHSPDSALIDAVASIADTRVRFTSPLPTPSGAWVIRLAPGDLVHEPALFAVANTITQNPSATVVYTDHDHLEPDGRFVDPHMKPDWNPDLLSGIDYFSVLVAYRADVWDTHARVGDTDHDLARRATARLKESEVVHLPYVLATRSVAGDGTHLIPPTVRVEHPLPDPRPRVSVLIPTRDRGRMLARCLASVRERTDYPDVELVIIDHETTESRARKVIEDVSRDPSNQVIRFSGPFNFSAMINRAAKAATGEVLVLLNNDTEVVTDGWINILVAQVSRPEVAIAGALLTFADGTIQHGGIHPEIDGVMAHGHKHLPGHHPGYFGRLLVVHGVAAVTGACLAIEASTFGLLGGLDEEHLAVAYNDVDLCLRARAAGKRVVLAPHARLIHHESVSRGVDNDPSRNKRLAKELKVMQDRWGEFLNADPAYSPNLGGGGFSLIDPPKTGLPPWR